MRALKAALTVGLATALPLGLTPPAYADDVSTAHDNIAWAETTAAHRVDREVSFGVVAAVGSTVDQTNQAVSYNHDCTGCRSVAIAFQAILVPGVPSTFAPENVAVTLNLRCTSCHGYAYADQYAVGSHGRTRLDGETMDRIESLQEQAERLARSGLSDADLTAALNGLANRFHALVNAAVSPQDIDREDRRHEAD